MSNTIVFIHGMFQNPKSWQPWLEKFRAAGHTCVAPAWPDHEGEPAMLRANPPTTLGDLTLDQVVGAMELVVTDAAQGNDLPIVIGHSVGGLISQLMVAKGLALAGVAISPVAPNRMLTMDWPFFKNVTTIINPFKGDKPQLQTVESFHASFCNTLTAADAAVAFEKTATHDSRNVLRGCLGHAGHIDVQAAHAPLMFISGSEDKIIPHALVERNANAYLDTRSPRTYRNFEGRSHYICNEPGWEEVADYVLGWITTGERKVSPTDRESLRITAH